jgi:hypothetical protein
LQGRIGSRDPHQIAEACHDDIIQSGQGDKSVDFILSGNAYGAPGAGKQGDCIRQQSPDAAFENGHGMCAANFHQANLPLAKRCYPLNYFPGNLRVPVFF